MKYQMITQTGDSFLRIRDFISRAADKAEAPCSWWCDRLNFTFAVSCAMTGTTETEWAERTAFWTDEQGNILSAVLTEGEKRGEVHFISGIGELSEDLLLAMFAFAEEKCPFPNDERGIILQLRIDPRFPLREKIALGRGYRKTDWGETNSVLDIRTPPESPVPAGYTLLEGSEISPALKAKCHSLSFGNGESHPYYPGTVTGFDRLRSMPDYIPYLDLLFVDEKGEPASMMAFWFDSLNRWGAIEPAGTVPAHRNKGLGRFLIEEGSRRLNRLGAERLWVGSDQKFYLSCGFKPVNKWPIWEKSWM